VVRDRLNQTLADRYTVERELGRGGMASVWLARDLRHQRPVALKVLHPELAGAIGVDRFLREIRLTAGLQHPHIIPVLDSGVVPGPNGVSLPWYAMAYVPGESLRDRLARERHLPIDEALRITQETAAALHAAHGQGVVHRDIKPENLLLAGGHVYVADFGIAKALIETGGERLTSTGLSIGTPAYMSPEQATAETIDARSDQYSLACVHYEMLAGEPPFTGPTAQAIVSRRLAEPARAIRPVRSAVPPGMEAALLRALERFPTDRFPDVAAFATALVQNTPAPELPTRAPGAQRVAGRLGATLLLVVIALGAWLISQSGGAAPVTRDSVTVALFERGRKGYDQRTPEGASDAIAAFTAAVRRDSTYAEAWAGLAKTYVRAYERGFGFQGVIGDSVLRLAVRAVERALDHDPNSVDAWTTQAIVSRNLDPTDLTPAFRSLRRALAIDSSWAPAWHFLAISLAETGRHDSALGFWRRAVSLDPSYTQGLAFMAIAHYWRRQYDSSMRWADSAIAVNPNYLLGRTAAGYTSIEQGNYGRGAAAFEVARRLSTDVEILNAMAGSALVAARAGRPEEAGDLLRRIETMANAYRPAPLHSAVFIAQAYGALGDRTRALEWLRSYTPSSDLHFQVHLRCDPALVALSDEPRFRAMLLVPKHEFSRGC